MQLRTKYNVLAQAVTTQDKGWLAGRERKLMRERRVEDPDTALLEMAAAAALQPPATTAAGPSAVMVGQPIDTIVGSVRQANPPPRGGQAAGPVPAAAASRGGRGRLRSKCREARVDAFGRRRLRANA